MIPSSIVIIGATSGIGAALVKEYASPNVSLLLIGRNEVRMKTSADTALSNGADVTVALVDMRDRSATAKALTDFDNNSPIDLLILAAGVKTGNVGGCEHTEQLDRVLDTNLGAVIHAVQSVLPRMCQRGSGQIALFSSMAAFSPHADLLSYSASKAGFKAYGTSLRRSLRGTGIITSVVIPGFVDTPMTHRQLGPTPLLVSSNRAAHIIKKGLSRDKPYIIFPKPLAFLIFLKNMLPFKVGDWVDAKFRAKILPDDEEQSRISG